MSKTGINDEGIEVGVMSRNVRNRSRRGNPQIEQVSILMEAFALRSLAVGRVCKSTARTIFRRIVYPDIGLIL